VQRRWYRVGFDTPKGNKARKVNIPPMLHVVLVDLRNKRMNEAREQGRTSIADDLLFPGEVKERPVSVRSLGENYFEPILEKAGLRRFTFHDMRHTFGSMLLEAGAPLPYVADQMGHASVKITAEVYSHLLNKQLKQGFTDRMEALYLPQPDATQAQPEPEKQEPRMAKLLVRKGGLEPPRFYPPDPKSGASANSATFATSALRKLYPICYSA
jgi:hypothetical protein